MRYWWVNQNQTYRAEVKGRFLWSPKLNANGARNQFYENMKAVSRGDVVFSYCDTQIKAIGIVTTPAQTGPKPDFGNVGSYWATEGWFVEVEYCRLERLIRPKDHIEVLRPFLPTKYSPLRETGDGLQSVYLAEVPPALADALIGLIGQSYWDAYAAATAVQMPDFEADATVTIEDGAPIAAGPTFRQQIVSARRGQGVFRANVLLREEYCRVTGVTEPRYLRASHIKPWRDASDVERLDGENGLLLSPHIDHLFDQGYISFSSSQQLLIVPEVRDKLLDAWGIDAGVQVGEFSRDQNAYLDYHRANIFKHALL